MAIPEQQLQDFVKNIEKTVKDTIVETLQQVLPQVATSEPFDPLTFRLQLIQDIEQKLSEFKDELAQSLAGSQVHLTSQNQSPPEKSSWLDKPISSIFDKNH